MPLPPPPLANVRGVGTPGGGRTASGLNTSLLGSRLALALRVELLPIAEKLLLIEYIVSVDELKEKCWERLKATHKGERDAGKDVNDFG